MKIVQVPSNLNFERPCFVQKMQSETDEFVYDFVDGSHFVRKN